ncbi:MAG: hypothetical protein II336_17930 [Loktanella sp.]|nr:hypothetical protein [Loktanella sp.]
MTEGRTLKELNVQPGDVVECIKSGSDFVVGKEYRLDDRNCIHGCPVSYYNVSLFRIVSRASDAKPDTPVLWKDMSDAQVGALVKAQMAGKDIQVWVNARWIEKMHGGWIKDYAYRIKPAPVVLREFWIVGGCEAYDSLQEAQDACSKLMWPSIIHVREVLS